LHRSATLLSGLFLVCAAGWFGACSAAPNPAPRASAGETSRKPSRPAPDECAAVAGKPPPEPLERQYSGVAAKARCQREVFTIMGGITHFLGVKCSFCHVEPNYALMTHNKHVANWMARELVPRLAKKGGQGSVWCNDCHVVAGKGTAKILANPRSESWAVEWMTTHLVEDFETPEGAPLRCKACHQGNLGSPAFREKIILTGNLPPAPPGAVPVPAPVPDTTAGPAPEPEPETLPAPASDTTAPDAEP
jgi:hypothetical protein